MEKAEKEQLFNQASDLFLRVKDSPSDPSVQSELKAFLASGEAQRDAYRRVEKIWIGSGKAASKPKRAILVLGAIAVGTAFWAAEPVRIALVADLATNRTPVDAVLESGDLVRLDAQSAFIDQTGSGDRDVELLKGAGFFDVTPDARPFVVTLGDVRVRAIGTAFETAFLEDRTAVAVSEGTVEVSWGDANWRLEAGDTINLLQGGHAVQAVIELDAVASWRRDQLVVDGMRFADALEIIERRLRGRVQIMGDFSDVPVTGRFDLSNPEEALDVLATTVGARVSSLANYLWLVRD